MTAEIISGTQIRKEILAEIKQEVDAMKEKHGKVPGLVTILVGSSPASISYVTPQSKNRTQPGIQGNPGRSAR